MVPTFCLCDLSIYFVFYVHRGNTYTEYIAVKIDKLNELNK